MNYFKLKGQMIFAADDLGPAAMILSNYFRTLAINIMFEKELELPEMAPETDIHLAPNDKMDEKQKFTFKNVGGQEIEIKDKKDYTIGVIDYDYLKHRYYFMAKKKERILVGDLIDIMNKICEMDK